MSSAGAAGYVYDGCCAGAFFGLTQTRRWCTPSCVRTRTSWHACLCGGLVAASAEVPPIPISDVATTPATNAGPSLLRMKRPFPRPVRGGDEPADHPVCSLRELIRASAKRGLSAIRHLSSRTKKGEGDGPGGRSGAVAACQAVRRRSVVA